MALRSAISTHSSCISRTSDAADMAAFSLMFGEFSPLIWDTSYGSFASGAGVGTGVTEMAVTLGEALMSAIAKGLICGGEGTAVALEML